MDDRVFDKFLDEEENNPMDLYKLLESFQAINLQDEQYKPVIKKYMEEILQQFNQSIDEQHTAISTLRIFVPKGFVSPSIMPKDFIQEYVELFSNPLTDIYIKVALLSLSNDMMLYCPGFVEKFGEELYYARVYEEMRGGNFQVDECLPVLNHFVSYHSAFSYLVEFGFFDFLLQKLEEKIPQSSKFAICASLKYFTTSGYFLSPRNKNLIFKIADLCLMKIIPREDQKTFVDLETKILAPMVMTLSNLLEYLSQTEYMDKIIESGVSLIVLSLLNEDNIEFSITAADFLCTASYLSDFICIQLQKMDVVQAILRSIIKTNPENPDEKTVNLSLYHKCAHKFLRIIYNTFVACSNTSNNPKFQYLKQESETYIFECARNVDFTTFLHQALNEGTSRERNESFSILAIILFSLNIDDTVKFANGFGIHDYLPDRIDLLLPPEEINNGLIIAHKLATVHDSSLYNAEQLSDFRDAMVCEEMDNTLHAISASQNDIGICRRAEYLIEWIKMHIPTGDE